MDALVNLESVELSVNQITEIKGLNALANLKSSDLERNNITEIKGLDSLVKLSSLNIYGNPIREDEKYLVGNPIVQYVVSYCREKKQKADRQIKERLEKERVEKEKLEKEAEKARLEKELLEKEWADFTDIGYLLEIGYKSFLFGDDICSN